MIMVHCTTLLYIMESKLNLVGKQIPKSTNWWIKINRGQKTRWTWQGNECIGLTSHFSLALVHAGDSSYFSDSLQWSENHPRPSSIFIIFQLTKPNNYQLNECNLFIKKNKKKQMKIKMKQKVFDFQIDKLLLNMIFSGWRNFQYISFSLKDNAIYICFFF